MVPENRVIIKEIKIIKFGKLKDVTIALSEGLNVIYGKNESGKSTIQLFLKAMLYGFTARKKNGDLLKERDRAVPWLEKRAEGILTLMVNDRKIEIHRSFGRTAAGDRVQVCDAVSGQEIPEYKSENIGEILFDMPVEVFEKTLFIKQNGIFMGGRDDELSGRLINLQTTGDEMVSVLSALEMIETKRRAIKARDARNSRGRLDILQGRLEECKRKKYDLSTQLVQTEQSRKRLAAAKDEFERVNLDIERLEAEYKNSIEQGRTQALRQRLLQIDECDKKLNLIYNNKEYKSSEGLTEEIVAKAAELEREIEMARADSLERADTDERQRISEKQQRANMLLGAGVAISVISIACTIVCAVVLKMIGISVIFAALTLAGLGMFFAGCKVIKSCKNILRKLEDEIHQAELLERERNDKVQALEGELNELLSRFGASSSSELARLCASGAGLRASAESLEAARLGFLGDDSYEDLKKAIKNAFEDKCRGADEIETELKAKRQLQMDLASEIKAIDSKMAYEVKITQIPSDIETEINSIKDEIKTCERQLMVLSETESAIKEAGESWKSEALPRLNERVTDILEKLTGKCSDNVRVSEDYKMRLTTDEGLFDAEYASVGAYEQLYLALRIAVAELIAEQKILFLDDILTAYDDERSALALKFLFDLSHSWQTFLFTCHMADKEKAKELGAHIISL